MKIIKGSITILSREGRLTLQVPDVYLSDGTESIPMEEVPDDWFMYIKDGRPVIGKEEGFLTLTRKGYEENKEKIREAFEEHIKEFPDNRGPGTTTWEDFEREAEIHFQSVLKKGVKYRELLLSRLNDIQVQLERLL